MYWRQGTLAVSRLRLCLWEKPWRGNMVAVAGSDHVPPLHPGRVEPSAAQASARGPDPAGGAVPLAARSCGSEDGVVQGERRLLLPSLQTCRETPGQVAEVARGLILWHGADGDRVRPNPAAQGPAGAGGRERQRGAQSWLTGPIRPMPFIQPRPLCVLVGGKARCQERTQRRDQL